MEKQNLLCDRAKFDDSFFMNLDETNALIKKHADRINELYGNVVFDEWAVISFSQKTGRVIHYSGPRKENFQKNFAEDVEELKSELLTKKHEPGDFEFARHGTGSMLDAFIVAGNEHYVIWNATASSMHVITQNPKWLQAQVPFAELADQFRTNPVEA